MSRLIWQKNKYPAHNFSSETTKNKKNASKNQVIICYDFSFKAQLENENKKVNWQVWYDQLIAIEFSVNLDW